MGKQQKARRIGSKIHNKINSIRQSKGRSRLKGSAALRRQAESYARTMAKKDSVGHKLDGSSAQSRYSGMRVYENCALVHDKGSTTKTADKVISTWMDSFKHRNKLLRKSATKDGVGVWFRGNKVYVAHAIAGWHLRLPDVFHTWNVNLNVGQRLRDTQHLVYRLAGRVLETPYAPIRAIDPNWWQVLPRRRQRSLTIGILLGAFAVWVVLNTTMIKRVPNTVHVANTNVRTLHIVVMIVIIGELFRYRR
jgi:hypothetical protein